MMKRLPLLLTFVLLLIGCSNPPEEPLTPDMQAIVDQGIIKVGLLGPDFQPYIFRKDGEPMGLNVEIGKALVEAVFGDAVTIEWVSVNSGSFLGSISAGEIDLDLRGLIPIISTEADVQWTVPYLLDGKQFMVKSDSGISEWADLANKTICFEPEFEMTLLGWSEAQGIPIEPMLVFNMAPFINNECVALINTRYKLIEQMYSFSPTSEEGDQWVTIGDLIDDGGESGSELVTVAVKPDAPGLYNAVNTALIDMINDGSLQEIYDEWLPDQPPWTLETLLDVTREER